MATFLLGVYLILVTLGTLVGIPVPSWVAQVCGFLAGLFFLVGAGQTFLASRK